MLGGRGFSLSQPPTTPRVKRDCATMHHHVQPCYLHAAYTCSLTLQLNLCILPVLHLASSMHPFSISPTPVYFTYISFAGGYNDFHSPDAFGAALLQLDGQLRNGSAPQLHPIETSARPDMPTPHPLPHTPRDIRDPQTRTPAFRQRSDLPPASRKSLGQRRSGQTVVRYHSPG